MSEMELERKRSFLTFRFVEEDRQLLKDIGRGRDEIPDRYAALCELTEIVADLDIPVAQKIPERRALRLGIPIKLDKAIREVADRTKQPYLYILLEAAKEYRRQFPYNSDPVE